MVVPNNTRARSNSATREVTSKGSSENLKATVASKEDALQKPGPGARAAPTANPPPLRHVHEPHHHLS